MKSNPKIEPVKSAKMVIRIGYNEVLVLDHKDGMKLVESLEKAEQLEDSYSSNLKGTIKPIQRDSFRFELMSANEYEDRKVAGLLNLSYDQYMNPEKEEAA